MESGKRACSCNLATCSGIDHKRNSSNFPEYDVPIVILEPLTQSVDDEMYNDDETVSVILSPSVFTPYTSNNSPLPSTVLFISICS